MRLVDELNIKVCAGDGGDGIVSWLRLKNIPKGGPAGGNGGKGGDVYIKAVQNLEALRRYVGISAMKAGDGKNGRSRSRDGEDGEDLIMELPVGSIVRFNDKEYQLLNPNDCFLILRGGSGGLGNKNFKSSVNRAPQKATKGKKGECATLHIELQVIADVGLIGKPNAGKSSLLNVLTQSKAKVGNYPFTTIEPNLGVFDNITLADIPGLIEGAHEGKGLGIKFLRHIKRTKLLLHLISLESDDLYKDYLLIRDELYKYDKTLLSKPEIVVFSKADLLSEDEIDKKVKKFISQAALNKKTDIEYTIISLAYENTLNRLKKILKSRVIEL